MKTLLKTVSLLLIVFSLAVLLVGCSASPEKAIKGVWVNVADPDDKAEFTNEWYEGIVYYGTGALYRINENKTLIFTSPSLFGGERYLEWDKEKAKDGDSDYWFISGDTLYFWGDTYKKQEAHGQTTSQSLRRTEVIPEDYTPSATRQNKLVGSTVHFGDYDWLILDVQGNKALVITKEIIEFRPYHTELVDITWEKCTLREYLNGDFYRSFSTEDKNRILESSLTNAANPEYGTDGGASTNDKIFLLSLDEANFYFSNDAARTVLKNDGSAAFWWLRSPGMETILAATVLGSGKQGYTGSGSLGYAGSGVTYNNRGVRPALWLTLN